MNEEECRRCLQKDMTDQTYHRNIKEYIDYLSEDMKVDPETYRRRLQYCENCGCLVNGMCRLCGCFVEIRAVRMGQHCAKTKENW